MAISWSKLYKIFNLGQALNTRQLNGGGRLQKFILLLDLVVLIRHRAYNVRINAF
jgi:hypothetical protein